MCVTSNKPNRKSESFGIHYFCLAPLPIWKTFYAIMRVIPIVLILLSFTSCDHNKNVQKDEKILFFIVSTTKDFKTYNSDSVQINKIKHVDINDTLLEQSMFELNGEMHWINLFTNYPHAPMDGGYLAFELDTLGIIYIKSTTWNSYSRLKCTNDSINNLIDVALENIILNNKFHNIDLTKIESKKTIVFKETEK